MDKTKLTAQTLPSGTVEVEGVGEVHVRGLSRFELLLAGKVGGDDVALMERKMLSFAMTDPEMTEKDVEAWQKTSPAGQIAPVVAKVNELSGVSRGASKEAYKSLREES
ncbi:hypothetical protein [Micromonospora zamorensis]|uniref:hypothetical protein n=1 Tax=Micromonospora zamorensis TaxID=709883 RepID=UPI00081FE166|nr:hypothetical protein [Micromonospora zamorensis]SCG38246.1 hypothetical protein GA0070619_0623 [Micromonospora zamorensis]